MIYKMELRDLSIQDKQILLEVEEALEQITLPTTYRERGHSQGHSVKTGANKQKGARQACFGYTHSQGKRKLSVHTLKHPHILVLFRKFMTSHNPDFEFDSVYVNRNVQCVKHRDSANIGSSLLVSMGDYVNIKSHSLIFDGAKTEHETLPFEGTRYSLVFFKL
jgi:hypothetical protein